MTNPNIYFDSFPDENKSVRLETSHEQIANASNRYIHITDKRKNKQTTRLRLHFMERIAKQNASAVRNQSDRIQIATTLVMPGGLVPVCTLSLWTTNSLQ